MIFARITWLRSTMVCWAKAFARSRDSLGVAAFAVIATMSLSATGTALTWLSSACGEVWRFSFSATSLATLRLVTSREAVWTGRVGSADSLISGRVTDVVPDVEETGVTSRSASAE